LIKSLPKDEKCSDVLLFDDAQENSIQFAHGHNEDDDPFFKPLNFLLTATFNSTQENSFTFNAYTYAGQLSGNAFGFNSWGMSISVNSLYPMEDRPNQNPLNVKNGATQYFVMRDLLESRSLSDAVHRATRFPIFTGFSANVGSMNEQTLINIETAPRTFGVTRIGANGFQGAIPHFNVYLHLNQTQEHDRSSRFRREKFIEMSPFTSSLQILDFLGDTTTPVYKNDSKGISTLATCLFNFELQTASIYVQNPTLSNPILVLPFQSTSSR